ncbi:DMT family transporter [Corallococcus sp. Z5C101001]|uniref:DMT family transporter n=1 Tax=Corallococcus sp. Z5C101001 TaxID=2596829 RepID=UPI00117CA0D5|nr:DMT family transporter [Corallococcus sp. Z5C101001]TSC32900.1 DMT family transporter [Corallococcus sp. Z5C101001]
MRRPVDAPASAAMVVICLFWGLQQVAIKAVANDVSPILQAALRSGVAAVLVWLFSRFVAQDKWLSGVARGPGLVVGALFCVEFLLIAEGLRWTTASHMVMFLYTAPMFAALGLHLRIPEERLTRTQWMGIGLAFAGIVVTFFGPMNAGASASRGQLVGDLMGVCGGAAWGLTTVAIRVSRLSEAPAAQTLFYQLLGAFLVLLPLAAMTGQLHFHGTALGWASLGYQAIIVSFISYLVWFWMLTRYQAAQLGALSFMTPLFGVAMGALLLDEHLAPSFLAGAALVLTGLLVVNSHARLRRVGYRSSSA